MSQSPSERFLAAKIDVLNAKVAALEAIDRVADLEVVSGALVACQHRIFVLEADLACAIRERDLARAESDAATAYASDLETACRR